MNITTAALELEYQVARATWGDLLDAVTNKFGLPAMCLYAVGSRETNLSPRYAQGAVGDGGHGHGVFQLDDRWHTIPAGFDRDIMGQARTAAAMLSDLYKRFGSWREAFNAYNSGHPDDSATTGGDYGPDVLERMLTLQRAHPVAPPFPGTVLTIALAAQKRSDVQQFQMQLSRRGWQISFDGYYGSQTERVVRQFQAEKHLAADGAVGPVTWRAAYESRVTT